MVTVNVFFRPEPFLIESIASYATWCRHDGTHQTRKCGPVQWNADLGKTSKLYMRSRWTALEKGVSKEVMKLARVIKKRFTALANGFRSVYLAQEGLDGGHTKHIAQNPRICQERYVYSVVLYHISSKPSSATQPRKFGKY